MCWRRSLCLGGVAFVLVMLIQHCINSDQRPAALLLKSCSVVGRSIKRLFPCSLPRCYQRLDGKRADQVLSERDELINVSQFIIRASYSPCRVANGNINHRLPHHDPSHILAAHLASVDSFSPKIPPGPNRSVWNKCQTPSSSGVNTRQHGSHAECRSSARHRRRSGRAADVSGLSCSDLFGGAWC